MHRVGKSGRSLGSYTSDAFSGAWNVLTSRFILPGPRYRRARLTAIDRRTKDK